MAIDKWRKQYGIQRNNIHDVKPRPASSQPATDGCNPPPRAGVLHDPGLPGQPRRVSEMPPVDDLRFISIKKKVPLPWLTDTAGDVKDITIAKKQVTAKAPDAQETRKRKLHDLMAQAQRKKVDKGTDSTLSHQLLIELPKTPWKPPVPVASEAVSFIALLSC